MANVPGPQLGFQLRILNLDEEVTYTSGLGYGFGMKVFVHNNSLQPRFFGEGVYVSAGQVSYIGVRRTFVQNEPEPYSQCIDLTSYSSELFDFITKTSNRVYRQKDCIDLCIQKYIIENCFCYYVLYDNPFGNTTEYCSSNSDVKIIRKTFPMLSTVYPIIVPWNVNLFNTTFQCHLIYGRVIRCIKLMLILTNLIIMTNIVRKCFCFTSTIISLT